MTPPAPCGGGGGGGGGGESLIKDLKQVLKALPPMLSSFFSFSGIAVSRLIKDLKQVLKALPPMFDATGLTVVQREAKSADGTLIPYFLVVKVCDGVVLECCWCVASVLLVCRHPVPLEEEEGEEGLTQNLCFPPKSLPCASSRATYPATAPARRCSTATAALRYGAYSLY